jgi:hypothetical protein
MSENINIKYEHVQRFVAGDPASLDYIEEHGFVVIANALDGNQNSTALSLIWEYLENLGTGIDRNNRETWDNDRWPTAVHGGILPGHGIGHSAAQWFIRDMPAVKKSFASIWDDEDLLVSFDGVALWRPWTYRESWKTNDGPSWMHIDQHPIGRPGKHCVQGLVNLIPSSPATGGNVMVPGSHKRFDQIPALYPERLSRIHPKIDHFRFPNDDVLLADTQPIICHMEAGDLMLWDSRTIHCSSPGLETPTNDRELLRAASLICMMPKSKSNPDVIEMRKAAVQNLTSTTNWSDRFINADEFPDVAAVGKNAFNLPPVPALNSNQRKLVGWDD